MVLHGKDEWIDPAGVEKELLAVGFVDVKVEELVTKTRMTSAEDFVSCFRGMIEWMKKSVWSKESVAKAAEVEGGVEALIIEHLNKKHEGKEWDTVWRSLIVTCVRP
jgi:hypothetical protein